MQLEVFESTSYILEMSALEENPIDGDQDG